MAKNKKRFGFKTRTFSNTFIIYYEN